MSISEKDSGLRFPRRRPLRDNPRLILAGMILLLAALGGIIALANRSAGLSPDFLTEFVLYGLWAADLTILLVLTFVLARNVIKLIVERRRALPFARFRGRLVAVLLGMTLIPAVLVLIVGSELIRNSVNRWFTAPVEEVLTAADLIASDYYRDRQARVTGDAERIARALAASSFDRAGISAVRDRVYPEVEQGRVKMVEVYRIQAGAHAPEAVPYLDVAAPNMPHGHARADRRPDGQSRRGGTARVSDARDSPGWRRVDSGDRRGSASGHQPAGRCRSRERLSHRVSSPRAPAGLPMPTKTTVSSACWALRSPVSICRSS